MLHSIRNYKSGIRRLGVLINKRRRGYFMGWMGLMLLISGMEMCQTIDKIEPRTTVRRYAEQMPMFPGGDSALNNYIKINFRYPAKALQENIKGTVYLTFLVNVNGKISDIKILKGIGGGGGCDEEAIRLIEGMPNWIPAKQNGKNVAIQMNLPIKFDIK